MINWLRKHKIAWLSGVIPLALVVFLLLSQTVPVLGTTLTNDPSINSGTAWTNPTNAYADGTSYADKSSGTAGNNTWGNYGFALDAGDTITSVRVRYDAYSAGNNTSLNQSRVPTADNTTVNGTFAVVPTSPTTRWDKVDDPIGTPDNGVTQVTAQSNGGGDIRFLFTAFTVPAGSNITRVTVYFRAADNSSGANNLGALIVVNDYKYTNSTVDPAALPTWTTYNTSWTTNPATGSAWTVDEVNGIGANALKMFGIRGTDWNPDVNVTQVYISVQYTEYNDQIAVQVSWDGGTSWSASQVSNMTSAETTYWYDVTGVTTWTATKLSNGQLQVRVGTVSFNNTESIRLDWLPVEVVYTAAGGGGPVDFIQDEIWW